MFFFWSGGGGDIRERERERDFRLDQNNKEIKQLDTRA